MNEETKMEYVKPEVVDLGVAAAYGGVDCRPGTSAPGGTCDTGSVATFCSPTGSGVSGVVIGPRPTP